MRSKHGAAMGDDGDDDEYDDDEYDDANTTTTHASALAVTSLLVKRQQSRSHTVPLWPLKVPRRSPFSDLHTDGT
jgi:hypothetical protein